MKRIVRLPFAGFYHSYIDMEVDSCLEREIEYAELDDDEARKQAIEDFTYNNGANKKIAQAYVQWVSSEIDIDLEFSELRSPRFYNFETDEILVTVDTDDLPELTDELKQRLIDLAKEKYTSRDGYVSFVSPNISDTFDLEYSKWETAYLDLVICLVCEDRFAKGDGYLATDMELEWIECDGYEVIYNIVNEEIYKDDDQA